ncbi:hypothetical protein Tco_1560180, partial [Tanacetum coccineum]
CKESLVYLSDQAYILEDLVEVWKASKGKFLVVLVDLSDPRGKVKSWVLSGGFRGRNTVRSSSS